MNIKQALNYGHLVLYGKASRDIDCRMLLWKILDCDTIYLHLSSNRYLTNIQIKKFKEHLQKRLSGVPIEYITGTCSFWSLNLKVTENTLIPREDTEILVNLVLDILKPGMVVIDLGTGTGAIALALAVERPNTKIVATDYSWTALRVAKINALKNNLHKIIFFIQTYWLTSTKNKIFDVIISNPPYIIKDDAHLLDGNLYFEPIEALASGKDGLKDIRIIVRQAASSLKRYGWLFLEHGYHQTNQVCNIFIKAGFRHISSHRDHSNNNRIVTGQLVGIS